jgi:hypothetical protein
VLIRALVAVGAIVHFLLSVQTAAGTHERAHGDLCGEPTPFVCGEVLVILEESATGGIEPVISRQGGNPNSDLLDQFEAVRDLLAPAGEAADMTPTVVYIVAVPVGQEQAVAEAYAADEAVYSAAVNRETIGTLTPSTAVPPPTAPAWLALAIVLLAGTLAALTGRRVVGRNHSN